MKSNNTIVINDDLIVKYLSGEVNPDEAMALNNWIEKSENKFHFEELLSVWNATHPLKRRRMINKESAWEKLNDKLITTKKPVTINFFGTKKYAFRIAASFLIIISGFMIYLKLDTATTPNINITTLNSSRSISFPDNSTATLYHNTSVTFPKIFNNNFREVNLISGEAFFVISHNKEKPFIIHTAIADIKVIGTEFNVIAKNDQLEVGVNRGKVMVYNKNDSVILEAGSTGLVKSWQKSIAVEKSINSNLWGYATRKFVFKDVPLDRVIKNIEKAYSCSIKVMNNNITNCKLTAVFDNNSAENILNLVAETLNLSVTRDGTIFTLEGEGCP